MISSSETIAILKAVKEKIRLTEIHFGRSSNSLDFVAVSKGQPFTVIESFYRAGHNSFAENYVQEALPKIQHAKDRNLSIIWHFIGHLQSNKLRSLARYFDWVQTLDTVAHAEQLHRFRPEEMPPLNCCIQIPSNSFKDLNSLTQVQLKTWTDLAKAVTKYSRLSLRGVMCLIPPLAEFDAQRQCFALCRAVFDHLKKTLPYLDTLSMGMTQDFEAAIAEGATLLRLGTMLFGPRTSSSQTSYNSDSDEKGS